MECKIIYLFSKRKGPREKKEKASFKSMISWKQRIQKPAQTHFQALTILQSVSANLPKKTQRITQLMAAQGKIALLLAYVSLNSAWMRMTR